MTDTPVTFKYAEEADIEILVEFMRELYEVDGSSPFDEEVARKATIDLIHDAAFGRIWLIKADKEAIGYAILTLGYSLEYHGRDGFLDEIYIRESYRGQGIGKEAIRLVEEEARALGVKALHLEVERENRRAQEVYRKIGFEDHDRYLMTKWLK